MHEKLDLKLSTACFRPSYASSQTSLRSRDTLAACFFRKTRFFFLSQEFSQVYQAEKG